LPLWTLSNQPILFDSCIQVESDQVAWVLHTEKFTTETGKGKGKKNSSQVNIPYFFLYKYTTAVCRQLLKSRNEIQHSIINLHGRAWQWLKSLGLLAWFMRATDTCSFAHACLYLFNKQRVNKTQMSKS
jgi:hypothetical protein